MGSRRAWLTEAVGARSPDLAAAVGAWPSEHLRQPSVATLGARDVGLLLGSALAELHALPVDECPFDASADAALSELREVVVDDRPTEPPLPEPYCRYSTVELISLVEGQLQLSPGAEEPPVVVHGDVRPGNWKIVEPPQQAASVVFQTLDRLGRADRHLDLAVVHRHLPGVVGAEALFAFYEAYGREPDLIRLDAYVLLTTLTEQLRSRSGRRVTERREPNELTG